MNLNLDHHKDIITKLCRVCGHKRTTASQLAKLTRAPTLCKDNPKEILAVFNINTWNDISDQHPPALCEKCARKVRHYKAQTQDYSNADPPPQVDWTKHQRTGVCTVCLHYMNISKPGRPQKSRRVVGNKLSTPGDDLPFSVSSDNIFSAIIDSVSETDPNVEILGREEEHALFTCPICLCLLTSPCLQFPCEHHFCSRCLTKYFQWQNKSSVPCPVCKQVVGFHQVTRSTRILNVQLKNLDLVCIKCSKIGKYDQLINHTCVTSHSVPPARVTIVKSNSASVCTERSDEQLSSAVTNAARILREEALKHKKGQPIPLEIENATDRWTWLKLQLQNREATLNTGGRPAYVQQVPQSKRQQDCKAPCSVSKSRKLSQQHSSPQQESAPQPLIQNKVSVNRSLAMMRDCHLAWDQMRKLRRYVGPVIASERQMRLQQKSLLKDYLEGEMVELTFPSTKADGSHGFEQRMMPYVTVNDLSTMVLDYLDRLEDCNSLTWHGDVIPKNEIWVKIGGDKGGSSFKMAFQIVNVRHPNSLQNTVVFACFEGSDTTHNLQQTLPKITGQITTLSKQEWRGHLIKLFCFGDYELLSKLYGTLGPNARHCCIYCHASKDEMQVCKADRGPSIKRTLESISRNYTQFVDSGSKRSKAKDVSFSIVDSPKLPIEIDYVILPSLHISLGVFKKLFDLLESQCHNLDLKLFRLRVDGADNDDDECNFDQAVSAEVMRQQDLKQQLQDKKQHLEELEEELPLQQLCCHPQLKKAENKYREMIHKAGQLRTEIADLECQASNVQLAFGTGPIASGLDDILVKHNVCRQAYHGKSFVGNHVHKCCQAQVIKDLTSVPSQMISTAKSEDVPIMAFSKLEREAVSIGNKFEDVLLKFADVHHGINHSNTLTNDDIQRIDVSIKEFLRCFRTLFPNSNISPKMHLLEDHAVNQLRMFKVGFGILNEQGGELIHTEFNRAGRVVHGMRDPLQRLLSIMKRHHTTTAPEIRASVKKSCTTEE